MNKKYILMGLAVWAFVSCSHDEIKDVYRENTIDFRVAIDTRAEETTIFDDVRNDKCKIHPKTTYNGVW